MKSLKHKNNHKNPILNKIDCLADEFACDDRLCIEKYRVCDGIRDCSNSEDEAGCDPAGSGNEGGGKS